MINFQKSLNPLNPVFVEKCPITPEVEASCACISDFEFPPSKQIDTSRPLASSKANIWKHLLILDKEKSPKDWESRIESDTESLLSQFSKFKRSLTSPYHPVAISNVSLKENQNFFNDIENDFEDYIQLLLYPDNKLIKFPKNLMKDEQTLKNFINAFLYPLDAETEAERLQLQESFENYDNTSKLLLACGHMKRDVRCGILGPALCDEFHKILKSKQLTNKDIKVGIISHIGGHAFAGNVIYFNEKGESIWYGRVFPVNCEGIVTETVFNGRIIKELYRGS
ncbi:hypothetical protein PACTADRAFT_49606 [Pachysolen tannophilus NRRL Y-2460]|uniref:Altered inheritance of mitochondria protein 32 n=1 Tax=Pachysolen tannophilus NRRL Y-2460 TaxID=669874 RepID=A0A1E4TWW1_PACTA|nr:hypothetical protein PACTADRAFT_49606 [Pachysolen tannophilus NRRL Y-2460]